MSEPPPSPPRAVVLGGYGLIGAACLRALRAAGFAVTGMGRDPGAARRCDPAADWLIRDIARLSAADWARDLEGVDVVVNAAGALQDGARDDLEAIHAGAVRRMIEGLGERRVRVIQISAAGVSSDAPEPFLSSKARGDAALMASGLDWVILRPTLVLGRSAYGGTALLRAAAGLPGIGVRVLPKVPVQIVALDDLAAAVVQAAQGEIASRTCAGITAPEPHAFADLTDRFRAWLGFAPWRVTLPLPAVLLRLTGRMADALGWLGWRPPLRSTALSVLARGIREDPSTWVSAGGRPCRELEEVLRDMPATLQDRWFARLFLLLPLAIGVLSLFWIASGVIGLWRATDAAALLMTRGTGAALAWFFVIAGALVDIALGLAVLVRRLAGTACLVMIAVSLGYLLGGTLLAPDLWADPLGPLVKVLPGMMLAGLVAAMLADR